MKFLLVLILGLYLLSCTTLPKSLDRKFNKRRYHFGTYPFAEYRWCKRWSWIGKNTSKNCKEWRVERVDISSKEGFNKFKAASFILIEESRI